MNENYRFLQSLAFLGIGTAIGASFEFARNAFYWGHFGPVDLPADFSMIWVTGLALAAVYLEVFIKIRNREQLLEAFNTKGDED